MNGHVLIVNYYLRINQKIHITKFFGLFILYKKNGTSPRGSTRYDILMYEIVASWRELVISDHKRIVSVYHRNKTGMSCPPYGLHYLSPPHCCVVGSTIIRGSTLIYNVLVFNKPSFQGSDRNPLILPMFLHYPKLYAFTVNECWYARVIILIIK